MWLKDKQSLEILPFNFCYPQYSLRWEKYTSNSPIFTHPSLRNEGIVRISFVRAQQSEYLVISDFQIATHPIFTNKLKVAEAKRRIVFIGA